MELGGLKPEGSAGKVVEVSKDTVHLRDSTILEADSGAPTAEDVMRKKRSRRGKELRMKALHSFPVMSSAGLRKGEMKLIQEGPRTWKEGKELLWLQAVYYAKTGIIENYAMTTASVHDSQVDLSKPGELIIEDKGYSGAATRDYAPLQRCDFPLNHILYLQLLLS